LPETGDIIRVGLSSPDLFRNATEAWPRKTSPLQLANPKTAGADDIE